MPRARKTTNMAPTTVMRWLEVYLIEMHRQVKAGEYPEEYGRKVIKGLRYSIRAMREQNDEYRKGRREEHKEALEEAMSG